MRGNRHIAGIAKHSEGSIPARAGEPRLSPARQPLAWVYPRACGGTDGPGISEPVAGGLSPRVRGNLRRRRWPYDRYRSIPARAGEPVPHCHVGPCYTVYPRACGGTRDVKGSAVAARGLSPRVRGNRGGGQRVRADPRSIPARAGEPHRARRMSGTSAVYPRACGGTFGHLCIAFLATGLSPRVRGNHRPIDLYRCTDGSIPARAGEPAWSPSAGRSSAVYPRACGGTGWMDSISQHNLGLSPRVRGNP